MIKAGELIEKFDYALDNNWGYIWGTAGDLWTAVKQKQKTDYMVSKYGTSWKKNSEAKDDNYYSAAMYGDKWIGHYVADCSGLFRWAFAKYKTYIAHGSNSIWKDYCTAKGNLSGGRRTDGQTLKPGTAVFTDKNGDKTHIGLYIGGSKVIEASGTVAGVCVSNVAAGKWKCWGELKNVSYDGTEKEPEKEPAEPTLRRGSKGEAVERMQTILYSLGYGLGQYGIDGDFGKATEAALKEFQSDHDLAVDGICGPRTWKVLDSLASPMDRPADLRYSVTIPHLTSDQASQLRMKYPDCVITEE